jgi:hypothetical protein
MYFQITYDERKTNEMHFQILSISFTLKMNHSYLFNVLAQ